MTIQTISGKKSPLRSGEFQETIADGLNGNPMQVPLIFLFCIVPILIGLLTQWGK